MTLYPSRIKWAMVFAVVALLGSFGVLQIFQQPGAGSWFFAVLLGLTMFTGPVVMLNQFAYLALSRDGFEQSMLGRRFRYRWNEVSDFGVWQHKYNSLVCFDIEGDKSVLGRMNRSFAGASGSLSDTFGLGADELAELMNRFRDRAMMQSGEKPF